MKSIPIRRIAATDKAPDLSRVLRIRTVESILRGRDLVHDLHRHDFYFVLVIGKGTGTHTVDFSAFDVKGRSVFFLRPGQVHELKLKAGSTGFLMEFSPAFCRHRDQVSSQLLRRASSRNHYQLSVDRCGKVLGTLKSIYDESLSLEPGYEEAIRSHLGVFFIELVRERQQHQDSQDKERDNYSLDRLEEFQDLLEKHVSELKKVTDYADRLHLSAYQLNQITKTTLGKTASELIDEFVVLEARRYLLATSNQVNQIAYLLGFEDSSYFIRFFRKHTGQSPDAFRMNFK